VLPSQREPEATQCVPLGGGHEPQQLYEGSPMRVQAHIPEVFRDLYWTGEAFGKVRASALQTILRVLGGSGGTYLVMWQGY
jgi:hypothetical protein